MPADDMLAYVAPERKAFKRPHWRDKLFSKDKNHLVSADQQVEAFLGASRPQPVEHHVAATTPRGLPMTTRLEVSAPDRLPSTHDVTGTSPRSNPSSATDAFPPVSFHTTSPKKARPRKHLRVKFSTREPAVMGEGGDECEIPTRDMRKANQARSQDHPAAPPSQLARPEAPETTDPAARPTDLRVDTSFGDRDRHRAAPPELLKGGPKLDSGHPLLINSPQDADFLMALNLGDAGSRLSFRASPESNSFAQRVRAKMQAEEGQALHNRYHGEPPSPANENPQPQPHPPLASNSPPAASYSPYAVSPVGRPETGLSSTTNTLRSPPSPLMRKPSGDASPIDPNLPANLTPGGGLAQHHKSPPRYRAMPQDHGAADRPPPSRDGRDVRDVSRSPQPPPPQTNSQPPKISLRSIANQFGDTAFVEFKSHIERYESLFQLAAETSKPLAETSLAEWIRAAAWWFLRGKTRLEAYARSRPPSAGAGRRAASESAKQAVLDLGKSLWINEQLVPQHRELSRYGAMGVDALLAVANTTGDKPLADLLGLHQGMMNHLRSLAMSIKRNNILGTLSPTQDSAPDHHTDTSIWMQYPSFAPDVSAVLSGAATRSMLVDRSGRAPTTVQMMPLGDNSRYFSYGSMFVDVYVSSEEDDSRQYSMPCVLSIIRDRADWYVLAGISSQSELVNVMIQGDRKQGPTWDDVEWQVRTHSMRVKLPRGFELNVEFQEEDFKIIWNIVKYTLKTEASLHPEAGESVVFENTIKVFQYMDPAPQKAFPPEPSEKCRLRLFERSVTVTEGTGTRSMHQGFRLSVVTHPKVKTLSSVRHLLGYGAPIVFGLLRGENGAPALLLKVTEDGRTRSMLLTFDEVKDRTTMHSLLLGLVTRERELKIPDIPVQSFKIEQPASKANGSSPPAVSHIQFPAGHALVIDQDHVFVEHGYGPTVLSEHLRVIVSTEWGSVTDRINLGPGELKLRLDVHKQTGLSLYRPGQQDLTVSVADNLIRKEMPDTLTKFLQTAKTQPMVRRFEFANMQGLHAFEEAVTGFKVLFDGVASSFTISRRRMVVPIYKKWEATLARIQVVRQDTVIQLLAFFGDFSHGSCLNFVLKSTDHMESFSRSGKFGIRIVDAKFALPKTDDDPSADFVCLDMPEYPIEHDDIAIAFDAEAGTSLLSPLFCSHHCSRLTCLDRRNFQAALPSSVREPSRMGSLRR
ncbi:hypothetical protein ASPZODRAFT_22174 [Penicilliopsis zonata CBS 506.65]|uniref:Uncharacterized protein n=1 Tax=Penicilliopsis zonata CBS 506.65 TaxID=1073090 RepID=A0A1L9SX70_9EURO|nr:hypothetical protein ASPZODRAFT_22174 [Penicilliopsis zonata CBS 506.65]OJJ51737.1 hypothetical protein ASPZODRAFT_22174 [Penicilliopsis zonata CBS 506.65]